MKPTRFVIILFLTILLNRYGFCARKDNRQDVQNSEEEDLINSIMKEASLNNHDSEPKPKQGVKSLKKKKQKQPFRDISSSSNVFCQTCYTAGTESCDEKNRKCHCGPNFMGELCADPRNSCEEGYNITSNGDEMCGKGERGFCTAEMGSPIYYCECKRGYTEDQSSPQPDCVLDMSEGTDPFKQMSSKPGLAIFLPFMMVTLIILSVIGVVEYRRYKKRQQLSEQETAEIESLVSRTSSRKSKVSLLSESKQALKDQD